MSRSCGLHFVKWLTAVCVAALALGTASLNAAPQGRFNAKISIYGYNAAAFASGRQSDPYTYEVEIYHTNHTLKDPPGGGLATFGVMDSGEVLLLHHIEYVPNLTESFTRRPLYPPGAVFKASDLPLYIMVCAWFADDGTASGPIFQFYTEREEVKTKLSDTSASVSWNTISSRRAKDKFAAQDYCDELSKTKQSSAPLWFPKTGY